ncbi:MAG: toll/interleukin-1 receptor domain-containing protein [Chromatiales bacterium]|nr:toll/interleukin-1 receptor domain-containing protein [Chromatiales bacterium]
MDNETANSERKTLFISKATPGDDEFVLWLAPRLEAAGYKVFADIVTLEAGDRWRKEITNTLQNKAIKMLLCCRDSTLAKDGVQEEIGIASDLVKLLDDNRFIIPLRLEPYKRVFGIGELQYVDFVGSWAKGLRDLLDTLENQSVSRSTDTIHINPNWEHYKKRLAIRVEPLPEVLTLNWIRIASLPDAIRYYQPTGAIDHTLMAGACKDGQYPAEVYHRGFFSFAVPEEIDQDFAHIGKFAVHSTHNLSKFLEKGSAAPDIRPREAKNLMSSMFRKAWERLCREKGLYEYAFSNQLAFHVTKDQIPLGKKLSWGRQGRRRSSMLRNISRGKVWQYGVSAVPALWPYPHFKLKSRVLFSELTGKEAGAVFSETDQQHRLRRSICKGWRNKAWHGRMMAFLELMSGDEAFIQLPLSGTAALMIDAYPVTVTAPVTTALPDAMDDDAEEQDSSTLGNYTDEEDV